MKDSVIVAVLLIAASVLCGCSDGHVTVGLQNVGNEPLQSAIVHVTGRSYAIGDIHPGETKSVEVRPSGDSHVEIEFSGRPRLVVDSYFERGDRGSIAVEVTQAKVVSVKNQIEPYP